MAQSVLRRSLIYVPGSSQRMLAKSAILDADCVIYDLEDAVTPANKAGARELVTTTLNQSMPHLKERGVRINSVGSGLALGDLQAVLRSPNLDTIVVPKVESRSDMSFIRDVIEHSKDNMKRSRPLSIIAQVESAQSLSNLTEICRAAPELLSALAFAAEDFALDLSIDRSPSMQEYLYARSAIVTAARAHNLPSTLDLVATGYKSEADQQQLEAEAEDGRRMGFNGKQLIHPSQIEAVNRIFTPPSSIVEWAVKVNVAQKKAEQQGKGAWSLDGKMIDRPVEQKAETILARARLCGYNLDTLFTKHAKQEPE